MEDAEKMLEEQQRELERIRNRRNGKMNTEGLRKALNFMFLLLALAGLVLYFYFPDHHTYGWAVITLGMIAKLIEFFVRFMF
ncbi:MAG: hypothetical protein K2H79_01340 [Bacteroidaceae bacterium]|nr:hypothetical protein [Bacteroidaceae bacterium]MDE7166046.1 hypothetical protein [Bacteroidaceae bacterium]